MKKTQSKNRPLGVGSSALVGQHPTSKTHQAHPASAPRRPQTVSVNAVERRPVELEHAIACQPQVAMAIRVDTHDLLARQPVFRRVVPQ